MLPALLLSLLLKPLIGCETASASARPYYEQRIRCGINRGFANIMIDLLPDDNTAPKITLSDQAYAEKFLKDLHITVDGKKSELRLIGAHGLPNGSGGSRGKFILSTILNIPSGFKSPDQKQAKHTLVIQNNFEPRISQYRIDVGFGDPNANTLIKSTKNENASGIIFEWIEKSAVAPKQSAR